jgi:hypothetical protein
MVVNIDYTRLTIYHYRLKISVEKIIVKGQWIILRGTDKS